MVFLWSPPIYYPYDVPYDYQAVYVEEFKPVVLGMLSIVFWSLTLLPLFKYILVVMNASDTGEGECGARRE